MSFQDGINSLEDWRRFWKSAEEGSLEAESILDDPQSWRILAQHSRGYQKQPDGKDYGADVDKVARTAPAPKLP
jgi:hypothetical protein